jgi:hypothetical protein
LTQLSEQRRVVERCAAAVDRDRLALARAGTQLVQGVRREAGSSKGLLLAFGAGLACGYLRRGPSSRGGTAQSRGWWRSMPRPVTGLMLSSFLQLGLLLGRLVDREG